MYVCMHACMYLCMHVCICMVGVRSGRCAGWSLGFCQYCSVRSISFLCDLSLLGFAPAFLLRLSGIAFEDHMPREFELGILLAKGGGPL